MEPSQSPLPAGPSEPLSPASLLLQEIFDDPAEHESWPFMLPGPPSSPEALPFSEGIERGLQASAMESTRGLLVPDPGLFFVSPSAPDTGPAQCSLGSADSVMTPDLRAVHLCLEDKPVKQFWESGFWGSFFGDSPLDTMFPVLDASRPSVPRVSGLLEEPVDPKAKKVKRFDTASFESVVKNREVISWRREAEHHRALLKWGQLFFRWDSSSDKRIEEIISIPNRRRLLEDYMARKAPATMLKRANSLRRLTDISLDQNLSFPMNEDGLYNVLHVAKSMGASLSNLRSIMEAIAFSRYTFNMESLISLCESRKCWGVGVARLAAVVQKAAPLRVRDLKKLHLLLREAECIWTRLFCGCALYCAYARCRWSDCQHIDIFTIEEDSFTKRTAYLSAIIDTHKTMNLRGKLPVHLELAAPGQGVTHDDWVAQFMKARSDLALGDERPFMPAPDRSGFPTVRALDTDEAGDWLRLVLDDRSELRTTSHSLKATFLSFAAKYGLSHQDRLVLGGHAHSGKMADVYGRDAMARPLRMLSEVIEAVRSNKFFPDASKARRFAAPSLPSSFSFVPGSEHPLKATPKACSMVGPARSAGDEQIEVKSDTSVCGSLTPPANVCLEEGPVVGSVLENAGDDDSSSSESMVTSSNSESSSESSSDSPSVPGVVRDLPEPGLGFKFVQHKKVGALRLMKAHHYRFTICGRPVKPPLEEPKAIKASSPVCRNCRKAQASA